MKPTRKSVTACVGALALLLNACSNTNTVADKVTIASPPPASPTISHESSVNSASTPSEPLSPDCSAGIKATAAHAMIERGSLPVMIINGPQDGEITDLSLLRDSYAPCDGLSYAIIGGDYQGEPAAFPVFFSHGATIGNVASFLGSPDMEITSDGTTITANSRLNDETFTGTYVADQFGSVTERSQGAGTKSVNVSTVGELFDASPRTTQYTFAVAGGTARCLVNSVHLECENPSGAWAFRYNYGSRELSQISSLDYSAVSGEIFLDHQHTIVGPPGHLMDFSAQPDGLKIHTSDGMMITITADQSTME